MSPVPRKMRQDSGWPGMSFIAWNKRAAFALERRRGRRWDEDAVFREAVVLPALRGRVADIGGGKNPFLTTADGLTYFGLDIDPASISKTIKADIPIVEHMTNLDQVPDGGFRFTAAPVKVKAFGTFPVRAFARIS